MLTNKKFIYQYIRKSLKYLDRNKREAILYKILKTNKLQIEDIPQPDMLTWEDLKRLDEHPLVEIGSHTLSHSALPSLNPISAWCEIWKSKRIIEKQLGHKISSFSYPYGANTILHRFMVLLSGYKYGFATQHGKKFSSFVIPRIDAQEFIRLVF